MNITGPHREFSYPYGKAMLPRREWFASDEFASLRIIRFDEKPRRYIIDRTYPEVVFPSLKKALAWCSKMLNNPRHRDWKRLLG